MIIALYVFGFLLTTFFAHLIYDRSDNDFYMNNEPQFNSTELLIFCTFWPITWVISLVVSTFAIVSLIGIYIRKRIIKSQHEKNSKI